MIIDFSVVAIILLFGALGYRRGFSSIAMSFLALALSALITFFIYDAVYAGILKTNYGKDAQIKIEQTVEKHFEESGGDVLKSIPVLNFGTPNDDVSIAESIAKKVSKLIISAIVLVITYIIAKLVVFILKVILSSASNLPVIGPVDSLLGFICGFLFGCVWAAGICFVLGHLALLDSSDFLVKQYNSSALVLLISDIMGLLGGI